MNVRTPRTSGRQGIRSAGLALIAAVVVGCSPESATGPAYDDVQAAVVGGGADAIGTVKGGGHFQLKDPPGFVGDFKWIYRFSVDARKLADGTDEGTIRFRSTIPPGRNEAGAQLDWWADVDVDCVEIDGNVAWMTGTIVRSGGSSPFAPPLGPGAMLIIRDNGGSEVDELNVGPAVVFGAEDCRDKPPFGGDALTDGNFVVSG